MQQKQVWASENSAFLACNHEAERPSHQAGHVVASGHGGGGLRGLGREPVWLAGLSLQQALVFWLNQADSPSCHKH